MDRTSKSNGQGGIVTPEPAPSKGAGCRSNSSASSHVQPDEVLRTLARLLAHDGELQQPEMRMDTTSDEPKGKSK
jgi:hypothetical protein